MNGPLPEYAGRIRHVGGDAMAIEDAMAAMDGTTEPEMPGQTSIDDLLEEDT